MVQDYLHELLEEVLVVHVGRKLEHISELRGHPLRKPRHEVLLKFIFVQILVTQSRCVINLALNACYLSDDVLYVGL